MIACLLCNQFKNGYIAIDFASNLSLFPFQSPLLSNLEGCTWKSHAAAAYLNLKTSEMVQNWE